MSDTPPKTEQQTTEQPLSTGAPVPVAMEYIEGQLHELWRDVAEAAQATGGAQAVTTAQVLNLVIHAASYDVAGHYANEMAMITGRHPARVITMIADPKETEMPVQASVSISCQMPPAGGRQVCCEQVTMAAGGESVRQLSAAVIPLLMPDLPAFLWWPQGAPFDDALFRNLADSVDRLILDSSTFENPEGTLSTMANRLKTEWPKTACTDMSWSRLTRWRELIAQFFDGPTMRPYLERINNVSIDFALSMRGGVNRTHALLLAGWLASRLGWQPAEPVYQLIRSEQHKQPIARLSLKSGSRSIVVNLNPGPRKAETPGEINSVVLEVVPEGAPDTEPPKPEARFAVTMSDEADESACTSVEMQGVEQTKWHVQMDPLRRVDLLDEELEVFSHERVYEEALEAAGAFIRGAEDETRSIQPPRKVSSGEPISAGSRPNRPPESTAQ